MSDAGSRPRLKLGGHLLPGLAAVALFAVLAVVFLQASFGEPAGFPEGASITASIGYAMFNVDTGAISGTVVSGEGFVVAFVLIAIVLDVAIDGAVFLAKRDEDGGIGGVLTDGGREIRDKLRGGED
ncbi:proton-conducting membrane transporter [Halobaculum magnesiiphilum]|uniref:Proton-conducting membrane transporter n=1 Tax=Halobaculum magnesiiphilum TaxID=1017351 RepID=A0A8T8WFR2_9EURY|nr:proton-conducting membrane transporter [Halobaculum magnesiiphilum]QZP38707.1 proton-conducting membrane transporter [Halobaculum magnesiiphilum]